MDTGDYLPKKYKGKNYRAIVRRNGKIRYNGKTFNSLSLAGHAITHRPTNGWYFWKFKNRANELVKLNELRK